MSVIDDYLKNVPEPQKTELERVRQIVMREVPEAEDTIGYGMPVLKYKKKYLIGFCPFKQHMSLFPGAGAIAALEAILDGFVVSKGTVQFTLDHPVPEAIIEQMVRLRAADIDRGQ